MGVTQGAGNVLLSGAIALMPDAATGHLVAGERRDVPVQLGGGDLLDGGIDDRGDPGRRSGGSKGEQAE